MILEEYKQKLFTDKEFRNAQGRCIVCGQNVKDREIALFRGLIDALYKVYCWCGENRKHEFHTKEIKHLLGTTEYARFGDLVRFGGLLYKPENDDGDKEKAFYGLNMARAKEFFAGQREIPAWITINQLTNEIIDSKYVTIKDFPDLYRFLDEKGLYDPGKAKLL